MVCFPRAFGATFCANQLCRQFRGNYTRPAARPGTETPVGLSPFRAPLRQPPFSPLDPHEPRTCMPLFTHRRRDQRKSRRQHESGGGLASCILHAHSMPIVRSKYTAQLQALVILTQLARRAVLLRRINISMPGRCIPSHQHTIYSQSLNRPHLRNRAANRNRN